MARISRPVIPGLPDQVTQRLEKRKGRHPIPTRGGRPKGRPRKKR